MIDAVRSKCRVIGHTLVRCATKPNARSSNNAGLILEDSMATIESNVPLLVMTAIGDSAPSVFNPGALMGSSLHIDMLRYLYSYSSSSHPRPNPPPLRDCTRPNVIRTLHSEKGCCYPRFSLISNL